MATSVTTYSVGLTMNASDYIRQSQLSRAETTQLQRVINSSRSPADQYARSMDTVRNALDKEAISAEHAALIQDRLDQKFKRSTVTANTYATSIAAVAGRFLAFSVIAGTVRKAITLDAEMQATSAAFEVFTGSLESSNKMLAEMRSLAERTPLSFRGIADSGKTLMAFNIPAEKVMATLQRLGDIAGGNAIRFQSLSLAYAKAASTGRLQGDELNSMVEAGFNPLMDIAERTGRSMLDLKKDMEAGLISFDMVEKAFINATSEGGRFAGMMDKIGQTSAGALERAKSKMDVLLADLGNKLSPLTLEVVAGFERIAPAIDDSIDSLGFVVKGMAQVRDVVNEISAAIEEVELAGKRLSSGTFSKIADVLNLGGIKYYKNAKYFIDATRAFTAQMNGDIDAMATLRDKVGEKMFDEATNERIDRHLKLQKGVTEELEKQQQLQVSMEAPLANGEQPKAGEGVIAGDPAKDLANQQKLQESFDKRIESMLRELDILENIGIEHDKRRLIEDGMTEAQAQQIVMAQQWLDKEKEKQDALKKSADEAKQQAKDREQEQARALDAAKKYFEDQRKAQMKMKQDIESNFKSVELGSADDVRMQAEQANRMLTAGMTDQAQPTEEQLLSEAKRQLAETKKQTKLQEAQARKFDELIEATKNPKLARAR